MIHCHQPHGLMTPIDTCNKNVIVFNKVEHVLMFIILKSNKLVLAYVAQRDVYYINCMGILRKPVSSYEFRNKTALN